ncbi:MAG: hypothetical protein EU547_02655 [Promethearchaeota archaeon]|nr:MAG: hypothetical protein EU547_02655 [Candidatus Lokiarchaeota archaeon]
MVFKSIERIKQAIPDILHIAMFYNNGTIFETTFSQDLNIPKLGENFAEILKRFRKVYNLLNFDYNKYEKVIFETEDISIFIIKLGEESNIALFFKKEEPQDINLKPIRKYLDRIQELIDMDKEEL